VTDRLVRLFVALSNMTYMVKAYITVREGAQGSQGLPNVRTGKLYVGLLCRLSRSESVQTFFFVGSQGRSRRIAALLEVEELHLLIGSPPPQGPLKAHQDITKRQKRHTEQSPIYTLCVLQTTHLRPSKEKTISPTPCILRSKENSKRSP
jgi:hypothetical protein